MPHGVYTTNLTGLPDNLDLARLNAYTTADGVGAGTLLAAFRESARRFGAFEWPNHGPLATIMRLLVSPRSDDAIRWRQGAIDWEAVTRDFTGDINRRHRTRAGGQVPQPRWATALGYTWETFRPGPEHLRSEDVMADMQAAIDGAVEELRREFLRAVSYKQARSVIGSTTGKAVGWVGGTDQDYEAPDYAGETFASHSHYLTGTDYADSADGRRALFDALWLTFEEHGISSTPEAPIIMLVPPASVADVRADANFVSRAVPGVRPGATTVTADVPDWALGKFEDSSIYAVRFGGLPEHYYPTLKSYGELSPRNPVRLFYPGDVGFGPVAGQMTNNGFAPLDAMTPLDGTVLNDLVIWLHAGLAVQAPLLGAVGRTGDDNATWDEPTIS